MAEMPTYEELQQRVKELENGAFEQNQAERALRESEEKYRSLVEATSDWIWEVDNEGVYTYTNSKIKDILGYEPEEIIGKTPFDFMAPDEQERLAGWFRDTIESRKPFEGMVNTNIHKDGRHVLLETSGVPIVDPDGNLLGYRGIDRNITRRKQAEEALRESEEKYRSILENIEEAYYEVDIAGRFTFFNDSLSKITGYSADETMGTNIRSYTDQNCAMEGAKAFRDVYTTGKSVKGFSWEITRKDGGKKHAEVSASLIRDGRGKGIGFLGIIRDVSERKQAEQQIKSSLKEKETLLKEIHHRVKNNMQIIISLLRLQSANIKDKKYAGLFKDSANRMKSVALIHETLYRSKDLANIDFNGYVKNIANPLIRTYTVDPDRIKLNATIEDVSLGLDNAIPCGLIINELISNALKYAFPEDGIGEIEINLRSINEDEMELTVSDNGIGIPAEIDVEKTESLGLQLVQLLAEDQLDGTLELDRDGGTVFRIRFTNG
jgi:PAS domain S-box-containing protein